MKRILVIEDETAINELICMNLEIAGYKPVPFFDGAKFSTHLKQEDAYDLALLDIMLPGKDGFEMLELLVRIDKVLSRFQEAEEEIHIRNVTINEKKHTVYKDGKEVCLRPMEFACLLAFWKYRNRVMTREQMLQILWGVDFEGETRTVDVHVGNLRKKLDFSEVIITIPRVGYRMEVE